MKFRFYLQSVQGADRLDIDSHSLKDTEQSTIEASITLDDAT
jgi:hypothetical protein